MKISSALIGFVIIGLAAVLIGAYYAEIATETDRVYENGALDNFNKISEIYTIAGAVNNSLQDTQTASTGFNILGDFLGSGFKVLKITFSSFSIYTDMLNSAIDQVPGLSNSAQILRTAISAIIFIIFTFFIVSVLVNRDV
jgi:hypothetical protein